ncbi:MAG: hypothetical protein COW01_04980 [Bdellovibrionales bacterium CG12_big_fil_rev_8_21_14_0_65_38_15]|nr:MAG: hypothetical protein COW79_14260 [Bdellovibrionales bacterium CG22_combo_CG10-13_8_21_14_all_38_13]PIQ56238.1 MAG: hypothetical protein COW01_04980 [Bdellovibrionales bacterium CG12_big_fil_rev_8_21_14_0_65_38_15]PIR30382.1 MAG: hypothetical protein COV38_06425 [Bdellovibrionales bacterium CG11_big_fil_rev_8_21_14_0_20_38_13]
MKLFFLFLIISSSCFAKVSLFDSFQAALKQEPIKKSLAQIKQKEYQYKQLRGAALPQVALNANYTRQDASGVQSNFFRESQRSVSVGVTQRLFSGFQEFSTLQKQENLLSQSKIDLVLTRSELLNEVAKSYVQVLYQIDEVELAKEIHTLSQKRVEFLQKRVKTGRSRQGELVSAQALVASNLTALEAARANLVSSRQYFSFLTGFDANIELKRMDAKLKLESLENYLTKVEESPSLKIQRLNLENAHEDIKIAKGDHWPTVDLKGEYFVDRESFNNNGSDWAVTVSLTLPLFESGKTYSNVKQASQARLVAESDARYLKQGLDRDIRILYNSITSANQQIDSFEKAVSLNKQNYNIQLKDYGLSLVNNLEVLQALSQYTESRSRLNNLVANRNQDYYRLVTLLGDSFENN